MKKFLLLFLAVITALTGYAEQRTITLDGISYRYDTVTREASVIKPLNGSKYGGVVVVPLSIIVNGQAYIVNKLEDKPFVGSYVTSLSLPKYVSVDDLHNDEFNSAIYLQRIYLHDTGATKLVKGLFNNCEQLEEVYLASEKPVTYSTGTFSSGILGHVRHKNVYVTPATYDKYKAAGNIFATSDFSLYPAEKVDGFWITGTDSKSWAIHHSFDAPYAVKTLNLKRSWTLKSGNKVNVDYVETNAFLDNTSLEEVYAGNNLLNIKAAAFNQCPNLKQFIMPRPCVVAATSFSGHSSEFKICVPKSQVNSLKLDTENGWAKYEDCIDRYALEYSVNKLGYTVYPLDGEASLTEIMSDYSNTKLTLSDLQVKTAFSSDTYLCKVTAIEEYAGYKNSQNIKEIDLSGCTSLKTIGAYAFRGASSLETLRLPMSLEYIDEGAFTNVPFSLPLKDIYCNAYKPCDISEYAFTYEATLHTPSAYARDAYKEHPVWGRFSQIAGSSVTSYGLSVMGVDVTDANSDDVLGDGRVTFYGSATSGYGYLTFADGAYESAENIVRVNNPMILHIQHRGSGAVTFTCSSDEPAIYAAAKTELDMNLDVSIYHNGVGIQAGTKTGSTLTFSSSGTTWIHGRSSGSNYAIYGFASATLNKSLSIRLPFDGSYSSSNMCIVDHNGQKYYGDVEIGPSLGTRSFGLKVMGVEVTSDNYKNVLGDGTVKYDPTQMALYFKGGLYRSASSFIEVGETVTLLQIRQDGSGTVTYMAEGDEDAVSVKGDAKIQVMDINLWLMHNGFGFVADDDAQATLEFWCSGSTVKVTSMDPEYNVPMTGFAKMDLINCAFVTPYFAWYDTEYRCLESGSKECGRVEIGPIKEEKCLPLTILGKPVPVSLQYDILGNGKVSYRNGTLTLEDVELSGYGVDVISSSEPLTVYVKGLENILFAEGENCACIKAPSLTITGDGVESYLAVSTWNEAGANSLNGCAILCTGGDMTITKCLFSSYAEAGYYAIGSTSSKSTLNINNAAVVVDGVRSAIGGFGNVRISEGHIEESDVPDPVYGLATLTGEGYSESTFAYYSKSNAAEAVKHILISSDDYDGIESPLAQPSAGTEEIYNLQGLRLQKMQKGINIVGGKKIVY